MAQYVAYTVADADRQERFATTDYKSQDSAERRRNELALKYGKEFCLVVAGIDADGNLHLLEESP